MLLTLILIISVLVSSTCIVHLSLLSLGTGISYPRLGLDGLASFVGFESRAPLTAARVFLAGPSISRASFMY